MIPTASASLKVTIDRSKHTVLVVDDNPTTRYATARTLRAAGFPTIEAGTGQEALDISLGDVSAVVLDVHLPDIGGFEVCSMIRGREATMSMPIVHLSAAFISELDKITGLNAGADAYLTHPAEPAMLVATVQALVRARLAEQQVHQSEAKFRSIYLQAQSGIALVDEEGRFQDANPALLEMLGRNATEIMGRRVADFAAPGHGDAIQTSILAAVNGNAMWREDFLLVDAHGQPLHVEWSMSIGAKGAARVAAVSNVSDRFQLETERKLLLEREQVARANAERHSRTKDDFVAVLSHELRNPLNAIMMNVHYLQRKSLPEQYAKSIQAIERNAITQARLISDILDVSRINSGKLNLQPEWVDAALLVSSSLDSMRSLVDQKKLELTVELGTDGAKAFVDPARFQQIFWNIFNNAVKFSNLGGPLRVALTIGEDQLKLLVQDQGKGIEASFLQQIFGKFTQEAAPGTRSQGGLGLGMSIVKHLVDLHAGEIAVTSVGLGHGTTVTVAIPLGVSVVDDEGIDSNWDSLSLGASDGRLQDLRILVVEDDREAAEMVALVLRERGAVVSLADDYASAIASLTHHGADLLVSDIGLPGRDGYQLIRYVRAADPAISAIPAIALTAFGRDSDRQAALDAGFDLHVSKPLQPKNLLDAVRSLIQQRNK